jgi:hypothetical protein
VALNTHITPKLRMRGAIPHFPSVPACHVSEIFVHLMVLIVFDMHNCLKLADPLSSCSHAHNFIR